MRCLRPEGYEEIGKEAMEYRKLGKTGIEVSTIALGCWQFAGGHYWGDQKLGWSIAAVEAALDCGINLFDTAEAYGRGESEEVLGKALGGKRPQAVIATKIGASNMDRIQEACENSLKRLGTDYIDLYQIHWPRRNIPMADQVRGLERLREQGKVRVVGVCNFGVEDLTDFLAHGRCETNQVSYSLLWRAIEYGVQQSCVENEVGILPYSSLMQGLLTGKYRTPDDFPEGRARTRLFSPDRPGTRHTEEGAEKETFEAIDNVRDIAEQIKEPMGRVSLAWLLHQPGVTSVIVGGRNADQVRENARAAEVKLENDILSRLASATEALKEKIGDNADMWAAESRIR